MHTQLRINICSFLLQPNGNHLKIQNNLKGGIHQSLNVVSNQLNLTNKNTNKWNLDEAEQIGWEESKKSNGATDCATITYKQLVSK